MCDLSYIKLMSHCVLLDMGQITVKATGSSSCLGNHEPLWEPQVPASPHGFPLVGGSFPIRFLKLKKFGQIFAKITTEWGNHEGLLGLVVPTDSLLSVAALVEVTGTHTCLSR